MKYSLFVSVAVGHQLHTSGTYLTLTQGRYFDCVGCCCCLPSAVICVPTKYLKLVQCCVSSTEAVLLLTDSVRTFSGASASVQCRGGEAAIYSHIFGQ